MRALNPGINGTGQPTTLGVMGGGQLGRMFVHAAQSMGFQTAVLDPDAASPAGRVSHHHVTTGYQDSAGLDDLARHCQAITTEFENVPANALLQLAQQRWVSPGTEAVAIAQDRAAEKAHFVRCGVPVAPHARIETQADLDTVPASLLPGILKTARLGYDGKGQMRVASHEALTQAWRTLQQQPCVLEKMLPLQAECSVIVARGQDGQMVHLPVQRNVHRDGILAVTEVHAACVASHLAAQAVEATRAIAEGLRYVGVLCVEFFVLDDGQLVVNEMAPRPHNSGHHSINACDVSQFELQVRTLARLPLVQPRQHSPAIMLNLLGDLWQQHASAPPFDSVLSVPGTHLHLYGKEDPKPGRKMGHLTLTGPDVSAVQGNALKACHMLGLAPLAHWLP
jgi:5-(carboxyamino)imidazole ribonucleotide synthase